MLNKNEISKAVERVRATMEIEGFKLSKRELNTLKKVAEGKLNSDSLINIYKNRVLSFTGNNE